ncbi:MAG: XDD4 family exosortase-dependent surface protein [Planctomycetota bacterium]
MRSLWGLSCLAAAVIFLGLALPAEAVPITFTGSQGDLAASASFDINGSNQLVVTLTNTSIHDVLVPSDVLTALFFDIDGDPVLTRISATLAPGSVVIHGTTDPGGVVGGEWAYKAGLSGAPGGTSQGISSSGFDLFGPGDRFPGNDLDSPASPDGMNYGILSAGDNTATGNSPILSRPFIKNGVVFVLGGLPGGFSLSDIHNVWWQYGTDLSEPHFPEPTTILLLASSAVILGLRGVARRKV